MEETEIAAEKKKKVSPRGSRFLRAFAVE